MRKTSLLIGWLLWSWVGYTQHYNSWYLGEGAGLSFNSFPGGLPLVQNDGLNSLYEGTGCYSDAGGHLLFYTNGPSIFNRNHAVMRNGDGILGHVSAAQTGLIVPLPNNDSLYYVFSTDAVEHGLVYGYRYSVVNMRGDGGLGEVIQKNVLLDPNCTERLCAIRHADGINIWVITNEKNSNNFKAWLVNCNGIQSAPVISAVGLVPGDNFGQLKASPDGKLVCQTTYPDVAGNNFQLFDFNAFTGQLTNPRQISNAGASYLGCAFSPNSRLLYVSRASEPFVDQFDCTAGTAPAINVTRVGIPAQGGFYGVQAGPDGKIYLNGDRFALSVINHPNLAGTACNFLLDQIQLGARSGLGLPAAINDGLIDPGQAILTQILDTCQGLVQFSAPTSMAGPLQWHWDFGDGATSTLPNPIHRFNPLSQVYTVVVRITPASGCGYIELSRRIAPGGRVGQAEFSAVFDCDSGFVRFTNLSLVFPDTVATPWHWDFGDGTQSSEQQPRHVYANAGSYQVTLRIGAAGSCLSSSRSHPVDVQFFQIQASPDQTIDAGQSVQLSVTGGSQYSWTPPQWLDRPNAANPIATPQGDIDYVVSASNGTGCTATDTVHIHINPVRGLYVPGAFSPDGNGLNDELKPIVGTGYELREFRIFNRWGQLMFSTRQAGTGWDGNCSGQPQPGGSYIWYLAGKDSRGQSILLKGSSILVR